MEDKLYFDDARDACNSLKHIFGEDVKLIQPNSDEMIDLLHEKRQELNIQSFDNEQYFVFLNFQRRQQDQM